MARQCQREEHNEFNPRKAIKMLLIYLNYGDGSLKGSLDGIVGPSSLAFNRCKKCYKTWHRDFVPTPLFYMSLSGTLQSMLIISYELKA